jgi:putative methionine-R-sulfoxide reductase with GAF domain
MSAQSAPLYPQPDAFKPPCPQVALDSQLYRLAQEALASLKAAGVVIAYEINGEIICQVSCGSNVPALGATLNPNSGLCGRCIREGKPFRSDDANLDPEVDRDASRQINVRSVAVSPVRAGSVTVGVLAAFHAEPNRFEDTDVRRLGTLAEQCAALLSGESHAEESVSGSQPRLAGVPRDDFSFAKLGAPWWRREAHVMGIAGLILVLLTAMSFTASREGSRRGQPKGVPGGVPEKTVTADAGISDAMSDLIKRAQAGDVNAQLLLARDFEVGDGVGQDRVKANAWYILASINGNREAKAAATAIATKMTPLEIGMARFNVGKMFVKGAAVPADPVAAYSWFELAKDAGDIRAGDEQAKLAAIITPAEMVKARDPKQEIRELQRGLDRMRPRKEKKGKKE